MSNEEAIKHVENMKEGVFLFQPDELYDTIINALKKESKTGYWNPTGHDINDYPYFKCSECGRVDDAKGYYCRWCGVRMNESKEL